MPYFLSGGLVFTRQDFRLMNNPVFAADLTASYRYYYRTKDQLYLETDEDVIFLGALDDEAVKDYADYRGFTVYRINGQRVRSLRDFVSKWKNAAERRIVIEFVNQVGKIVIDRDKAGETDRRINERFRPQENGRVY